MSASSKRVSRSGRTHKVILLDGMNRVPIYGARKSDDGSTGEQVASQERLACTLKRWGFALRIKPGVSVQGRHQMASRDNSRIRMGSMTPERWCVLLMKTF